MNRKDVNQLYENSCLWGWTWNKNSTVLLTFKNKIILYTVFLSLLLKNYLFLATLGPHCHVGGSLVPESWGHSLVVWRLLTAVASFAVEHTLGMQASTGRLHCTSSSTAGHSLPLLQALLLQFHTAFRMFLTLLATPSWSPLLGCLQSWDFPPLSTLSPEGCHSSIPMN